MKIFVIFIAFVFKICLRFIIVKKDTTWFEKTNNNKYINDNKKYCNISLYLLLKYFL